MRLDHLQHRRVARLVGGQGADQQDGEQYHRNIISSPARKDVQSPMFCQVRYVAFQWHWQCAESLDALSPIDRHRQFYTRRAYLNAQVRVSATVTLLCRE